MQFVLPPVIPSVVEESVLWADVVNEEQRYACHRQALRLEDPLRSATRPYGVG